MAPMTAHNWLGAVQWALTSEEKKTPSPCARRGTARGRDFDIAEVMEEGCARELVSGFMEPLPQSPALWRFRVLRSAQRLEYRLYGDTGEFLMYAKVEKKEQCVRLYLYDPCSKTGGLFDASEPAFTLRWNSEKTEWRLLQHQSDELLSPKYAQTQQEPWDVLQLHHSWQQVGEGKNLCMDIRVLGSALEEHWLTTQVPEWNQELECLVMDFPGRQVTASSKNFQLKQEAMSGPEEVICQHGKIGPNTFALDFKFPLTIAQAFGISLTTLFWT